MKCRCLGRESSKRNALMIRGYAFGFRESTVWKACRPSLRGGWQVNVAARKREKGGKGGGREGAPSDLGLLDADAGFVVAREALRGPAPRGGVREADALPDGPCADGVRRGVCGWRGIGRA